MAGIMLLKGIAIWFVLMVLAILNGTFRESVLNPRLGAAKGHVASTIILCAVILAVSWIAIGWVGPRSSLDSFIIGGLWLVMTLAFELGFGRTVARKTWKELLADYDLTSGRIWILVLITVLIAPWIAARWRGFI